MNSVYDKTKMQFGKTAQNYVSSVLHAKGADLEVLVGLAGEVKGKRVLDVATGGGHTALAFARAGAEVTASDLTPKMLSAAKNHLEASGVNGVSFKEAQAEDLPFDNASFDIVTCRIAPHHFADPALFVRESARVLKQGGQFLLVDNLAPSDVELAEVMNHIERVRDPSHVKAYTLLTWLGWVVAAGLEPHHFTRFERTKPYATWIGYAEAERVQAELETYILGLSAAQRRYFRVAEENGRLVSLAHEVMLLKALKV